MTKNTNTPTEKNSSPMNFNPSRRDLLEANYYRHLNECKSIITFLGSFTDYESIRKELNNHITNLINSVDHES